MFVLSLNEIFSTCKFSKVKHNKGHYTLNHVLVIELPVMAYQ